MKIISIELNPASQKKKEEFLFIYRQFQGNQRIFKFRRIF